MGWIQPPVFPERMSPEEEVQYNLMTEDLLDLKYHIQQLYQDKPLTFSFSRHIAHTAVGVQKMSAWTMIFRPEQRISNTLHFARIQADNPTFKWTFNFMSVSPESIAAVAKHPQDPFGNLFLYFVPAKQTLQSRASLVRLLDDDF
jgi:hypothetical protein